MKKIAIIISHTPNPRILKRIKSLENDFIISLIYWDRGQSIKRPFEINEKHKVTHITVNAAQGNMVARIIPLMKYLIKVLRLLITENPEIIHAANMDMLFIATTYRKIYNKKVKIIYEVADLPNYSVIHRINSIKSLTAVALQWVEKRLTRGISKLILTSPYFWEVYFSKFISKDKYMFIPNTPSRTLFSKYIKKEHERFTVGFIGSVRYVRELKMLIDAAGEVSIDIEVFIAGIGPGYQEIYEYCRDKKYVKIYGPYNYEKDIVYLYEEIDCTYSVYNAQLENVKIALPNRLYESIVCEIPIIASKDTMLGEFIVSKQIGTTIAFDDKEELKKQIYELATSKKKLRFYQENCKRIKHDYYYEKNSQLLLNEYKIL